MKNESNSELNRRDFIAGGSFATLMALMGGIPLHAAEEKKDEKSVVNPDGSTNYKAVATPVNVGVIGCGLWAREIIKTLALMPNGPVVALCDTYPAYLRRAAEFAPKAQKYSDYKELLADKNVQAVVVSTPSHHHKDLVLECLKAGKHVYCEAPIANTVEDAKAIAAAAKANPRLNFQPGLQNRSDKQIYNLYDYRIKTSVWGKPIKARLQYHKKQSWRLTSPNPDREKEINWRLDKSLSLGLAGEIGIHQLDIANWYYGRQPVAVTGYGSITQWKDGREVPDTIALLIEYPDGVFADFQCTLGSSFEAEMNVFYGSDGAIMMRERKAWLFKEADAPVLGWEVYSQPEEFYRERGLILGAGATKQDNRVKDRFAPADETSALRYSLDAFLVNSHNLEAGIKDFIENYGESDAQALLDFIKDQAKNRLQAATWKEGYEATVTAIKANEAATQRTRVVFQKDWFEV